MSIKFLCPNGHQLTCGDDRAGKPGKCPKCGTAFVVPDAEEIAAAASNGAASRNEAAVGASQSGMAGGASGKSAAATAGSASGVGKKAPLPADQIVFLCPNGHRLNGPKSLQGRAGQCPHCGEKFRIPVYEEEEEEVPQDEIQEFPAEEGENGAGNNGSPAEQQTAEDEIPVGKAVENNPAEESEAVETFPEEVEIIETIEEVPLVPFSVVPTIPPLPPGPSHQLFDVFSRLWSLKPDEAVVELLLKDGKTVRPAKYSPTLSRQGYGVFATREGDGSYRLLAIAWESVARIEFAQLHDLPPGVFD